MIKVVNPLFKNAESEDYAYKCSCVCYSMGANYDAGNNNVWIPFGETCGCGCNGSANQKANKKMAKEA